MYTFQDDLMEIIYTYIKWQEQNDSLNMMIMMAIWNFMVFQSYWANDNEKQSMWLVVNPPD